MAQNTPAREPSGLSVKNDQRPNVSENDKREIAEQYRKAVKKLNRSGDKEIETALRSVGRRR